MSAGLAERTRRIEYGDFQTPPPLAQAVCRLLRSERPATLIEPTCGTGRFLEAALRSFPRLRLAMGFDINPRYVAAARRALERTSTSAEWCIRRADFFGMDWPRLLAGCQEPFLILGNPPWVTNSALGVVGGGNLPPKENPLGRLGLEGLTGKSNFDVSEWMIYRLLEALAGRRATVAMLCKTAVARRVLTRVWETGIPLQSCEIRAIDAPRNFGARVGACLFVGRCGEVRPATSCDCPVFDSLESPQCNRTFGWRDGRLVADVSAYERVKHLCGGKTRWRSGIKHDCAAVFEFCHAKGGQLINGLGEVVDLEDHCLYPLVKSSDIGRGHFEATNRTMLVPQRRVGEETDSIARRAPKTWRYLGRHVKRLDLRASRVYQGQPRFSIFGVGPYTFARWKVAVSGFYKTPHFTAIGPVRGRPVVCDDTCYFLPSRTAAEARSMASLLNGPVARDFLSAFVFPDAKRPLTAEILNSLDLEALVRAEI